MNDRARRNPCPDQRDSGALARHDEWHGATADLSRDDHDLALARLFFGEPAVDTFGFAVLLLLVTAGVEAVDVNLAAEFRRGRVMHDGAEGFPDFVREYECRPILAIEIAAELEGAMSLRAVDEDRDGKEVVADRALAILKDRPRRNRELIPASGAFPQFPRRVGIDPKATAFRAIGLAVIVSPADRDEPGERLLIRHARDGR